MSPGLDTRAFFDWDTWIRVFSLTDYNTRVVIFGTTLLGVASGLIGTYMLLRKRALMADVVSHSTLPGIGLAFLIMAAFGGSGKWLPGLLLGALISGILGMLCVLAISYGTPVKEDAALAIVLSVFFGLGVAILGLVQKSRHGSAAGLESFVFGKTASMLAADAYLIGAVGAICVLSCLALNKELTLLCFDRNFASTQGWPVLSLDIFLMLLVVISTVIGLQAVGLILVIALLIIPPAAARFWTDRLNVMIWIAAGLGGLGAGFGAAFSALAPKLPAGAVIVVTQAGLFVLSLLFGPTRGLLSRWRTFRQVRGKTGDQHLLRALYENEERRGCGARIQIGELQALRSWSIKRLQMVCSRALSRDWIVSDESGIGLTESGRQVAVREVRNHRLWELYLIHYADVATSQVDRDADRVEHILDAHLIEELENLLSDYTGGSELPSPHPLSETSP